MGKWKHVLVVFALAAAAGGVLWYFAEQRQAAAAGTVDASADVPATETSSASAPDVVDARMADLQARPDGARLLYAPEGGETILRAGFIDNRTLVVSTNEGGGQYRLFSYDVISRDAASEMRGATPVIASNQRPAHKNAGKSCYAQQGAGGPSEIWCADLAWKRPQQLTTHDGQEDLIEPTISPDGSWIAFEVNTDRMAGRRPNAERQTPGTSSVWKIRLDGSGLQQLTRGGDDRFPSWSEEGQHIFFQRRAPDGNWDLYVMKADGSDPAPILRTVDQDERFPTPVAGTDEIAAAVGPSGGPARLRVIDMETKAGFFLTDAESGSVSGLSTSPDGRLAAFLAPVDPQDPSRLGIWLKGIEMPERY